MFRFIAAAAALITAFTITSCRSETGSEEWNSFEGINTQDVKYSVNLGDKGIVCDDIQKAKHNREIINKAIKNADEFTSIVFPDGTYFIDGSIYFSGKQNIILCGSGDTTLINSSYKPIKQGDLPQSTYQNSNIFFIEKCGNITVSDLTVDYINPTTLDGVITRVENGKTYFKAYDEFLSGKRNPVTGNEVCFSALVADKENFYNEAWLENGSVITKESDEGVFSIPTQVGKEGDRICCRISSGTYSSPLFYISETAGLDIRNINCYSCPSAFIYAPYCNRNFNISGLNIKPEENSLRMLSSNEDMIHIKHMSGYLNLTDSSFYGLGDDVLNIHTKLLKLSNIEKNKASVTVADTGETPPSLYFAKGHTAEFFDPSGNSFGASKVLSYDGKKIEFEAIPEGVTDGCLIQNTTFAPDTNVENCSISFGRARGVLLQTKTASVKNCSFGNLRLSAILISPDFDNWLEAGYCDSIEIEANKFNSCASLNNGFGVIHISGCHDNPSFSSQGTYHKEICVKGNAFTDCKAEYVKATGVERLIEDN